VSWFDRRTGRFTTLGTADGLPHSFVYGILEDARGNLWLSTDDGIAMLDPRTRAITRYGLEDGLQAREFNRRAFHRSRDGAMYFGGINGVNVFHPDDVAAPPPPPPVSLLMLRVAGEPQRLIVRLTEDSVLTLRHDQNALALSFAALDFTAPAKVRLMYRLEGVDRDWVAAGARREASYTNVPPGRYLFRVTSANAAGLRSPTGAAVTIVITPPWWGTWWARVLAGLIVVGALYAAMRLRLRAARRRSALLERRVGEQTRDLTLAQERLRDSLDRERETARELYEMTAAVPGAVFQLSEAPDGSRSFSFVSDGILRLCRDAGYDTEDREDPRQTAARLITRIMPSDRAAAERSLALSHDTLEPWRADLRWSAEDDGEIRWLSVQARATRHADGSTVWTGVMVDATEERRAAAERTAFEAKMREAQKAESLGILAGGIAHDFNNLLVGVLGNAHLLQEEMPSDGQASEMLGEIRTSATRAAELTQQMLAYAGKAKLVVGRVDLSELVREMLALLRSAVPRTIAFEFHPGPPEAVVQADATQLRQVVMNLVTNASEATVDGAGRVTVRVGIEDGPQRALQLLHAAPDMPEHGPYVSLEVSDDGCGMDPSQVGRIFEPFYSTKFTGRGLGLAALLGIVRSHHGGLHVVTAPEQGTQFRIYLPLAERGEVAPLLPDTVRESPSLPGPLRVLVVDDEDAMRVMMERALRKLGHEVVTTADGSAALGAVSGSAAFDVVLMDVTMPMMDGPATARALREKGVEVPIVLMSGYAEEDLVTRGLMTHADGFVKKPFVVPTLLAVVHEVVSKRR
jgi:signal transduction histidine kinase